MRQDRGGNTPLHLSATGGHIEMSRLLLDKGASVTASAKDGATPMAVCQKRELKELISGETVRSRMRDEAAAR